MTDGALSWLESAGDETGALTRNVGADVFVTAGLTGA